MDKVIKRLDWLEGYDNVSLVRNDSGKHIMFDLVLEEGELLTKATQPLWTDSRFPDLQPGCVWVKNYSEHRLLGAALIEAGVLKRTGRRVEFGPYDASSDEYWLTTEFGGTAPEPAWAEPDVLPYVDTGELEVVPIGEMIQDILKRIKDAHEQA